MARYFSKKVDIDGITFDSEMESKYYLLLKERIEKGEVSHLSIHRVYQLIPDFRYDGVKIKGLTYEADFVYFDHVDGRIKIEDVKGHAEQEFKQQWKLLKYIIQEMYNDGSEFIQDYTKFIHTVEVEDLVNREKVLPVFRIIKWSKTTGFVDYKDYKKAMASAKARAIMEKNEAVQEKELMKKDLKTIKTLKAKKTPLTKLQGENLEILCEKYKEFI